ncbi:hypothetical protein OG2516_04199 [Oceanicola granulosus HTCC2516]|uniref:Beta-lactamase hydrolase-like protein phosphatase-like domain-containing protein n=1 Tax=Oceanicola granulosus (strain ATCC BAA-861 / DSM 15982 / KCTC 12143 / HTCC2516) TaxID=314256 RepID=Q2CEC9_OCEGH|nr:sulfur transferase domain-containing protein [Oceanicola granulosus]EAR51068.1 hypothetical protein OG2516_04199 [Oceanicola granulosus HTCC2516]
MDNVVTLDPRFTVATFAPDQAALAQAQKDGFRAVVNLRTASEKPEIAPDEEERIAREAGLAYLHHPTAADGLDAAHVDEFRRHLASLPDPVLVHCASGKRAGALTLMALGAENGWSGDEALAHGRQAGLDLANEQIGGFVSRYLDDKLA